jgi:murein DD-endopeptidase MepM/ murein hydrolase activator NlpD
MEMSTTDLWLAAALELAKQHVADAERLLDGARNQRDLLQRIVDRLGGERKYCAPVGTEAERRECRSWPGKWVNATKFMIWYAYGLHTGNDLNLNSPYFDADAHSPVYAISSGKVYAVRTSVRGWHTVVCIRHEDCLSRYAHVENIQVHEGQAVEMGQQIANIGNAGGRYPYHLHFDIAKPDARMARYPLDWPSNPSRGLSVRAAENAVRHDYFDPTQFLKGRV